jgi:hypothetical protein
MGSSNDTTDTPGQASPDAKGSLVSKLWPAVLVLACGYYFYATKIKSPLTPFKAHIQLVQAGQFDAAYKTMSKKFRAKNDQTTFKQLVKSLPGVYKSTSQSWYAIGRRGRKRARKTGLFQVMCELPSGTAIYTVQLMTESDGPKVHKIEMWKKNSRSPMPALRGT